MTNPEIIQRLRANGYRVRIRHLRYVDCAILVPRPYPMAAVRVMGMGRFVDPHGGVTCVDIERPGAVAPEHLIRGVSRCSCEDNFVQKDGLRMAFVDALAPEADVLRSAAVITSLTFSAAGRFIIATVGEIADTE